MSKLKKVGLALLTSPFLIQKNVFASGLESSKLVTGTQELMSDITNWLLIIAPTLTVLLLGYYLLRKSASDEMDSKKWDNRIKVALLCCIGVVIASGLINVLLSYYK